LGLVLGEDPSLRAFSAFSSFIGCLGVSGQFGKGFEPMLLGLLKPQRFGFRCRHLRDIGIRTKKTGSEGRRGGLRSSMFSRGGTRPDTTERNCGIDADVPLLLLPRVTSYHRNEQSKIDGTSRFRDAVAVNERFSLRSVRETKAHRPGRLRQMAAHAPSHLPLDCLIVCRQPRRHDSVVNLPHVPGQEKRAAMRTTLESLDASGFPMAKLVLPVVRLLPAARPKVLLLPPGLEVIVAVARVAVACRIIEAGEAPSYSRMGYAKKQKSRIRPLLDLRVECEGKKQTPDEVSR